MTKLVLFGGTSEGRALCSFCSAQKLEVLCCVATPDGARMLGDLPYIEVHVGRLNAEQMAELLKEQHPELVVDATHPYAKEVSNNLRRACQDIQLPILRVIRDSVSEQGDVYFETMDDLIAWLETVSGTIFVTLGSSSASVLTKVKDYQKRIRLRILPGMEAYCQSLGYPKEHIIAMQGPFSEEANLSMFKETAARILVSKSTGVAGGFPEKVRAARALSMMTAVLTCPKETDGVLLEEAKRRLMELKK